MAYSDQTQDFRKRATAIAGTVAVHAALGIAIISGLTIAGYKPVKIYDPPQFPLPKPPEPKPAPTPTASTNLPAPTPPAPTPPLPMPPQPDPWNPTDQSADPLPFPDPGPTANPEPRPSPSFTPRLARPRNQTSGWLSPDDYPRAPLVDGVEGVAAYRLIVGTNGRVSACEVTRSTGNGQLDAATCKFIQRRARFEPATDESGAKVVGSYTGTVKWEIPE